MPVNAKPPRSFRVLGQRFDVRTFAHIQDEDGTSLLGDVDQEQHLIRLGSHVAGVEMQETLLHEALHAMFHKAGFAVGTPEHEDVVNRLSPILLLFLQQNPSVYTYLTGRRLW